MILGRSGIGDGDGFLLMLGPEWVEAGCDFGFGAGDEPVAVGESGLGAELDEADGGEVDTGAGGRVGGLA